MPATATGRHARATAGPGPERTSRARCAALYVVAATLVVALAHLWRGESYWNFSEGVYLATARALADGASIYTDVAAAQPPPFFFLGAGLIAISDSLLFVRGALAITTVATGGLVAVIVGRLTGRPAAAVAAGLAALVMPWTIREHATLTPDPLAAAPLLGAALLASRSAAGAATVGGALAALGASLKLPFVLPAAAIWLVARRRAPFLLGAVAVGGALAAVSLAVWGTALWDNLVGAQGETGFQLGSLPGLVGQTIWNIGPLLLLAGLAVLARDRARDPALFRTALALLVGSLALTLTFLKDGTYLNTLVALEPVAVVFAAVGLVWFIEDRSILAARRRAATAVVALTCALVAAQSISLLAFPESPVPFGNPFLSRAPGHELSDQEVHLAAEAARGCPLEAPYSGSPFIAFVADRRVPGGQPDRFIVGEAELHADFQRAIDEDARPCPYPMVGGLPEGGNAGPLVK